MSVKEGLVSVLKGLNRDEIEELLLNQEFCGHCELALHNHVQLIHNRKHDNKSSMSGPDSTQPNNISERFSERFSECSTVTDKRSSLKKESNKYPDQAHSRDWTRYSEKLSPTSVDSKHITSSTQSKSGRLTEVELVSDDPKERVGFANVVRKTNFTRFEKVNGKNVNVVQGLELHTRVFDADEQKKIVEAVYEFQRMGQKGRLRERTYTEPSKWMRGKGRVTIQFGCCYNYAVDKNGNPPGIIINEEVDPLPPIFIQMIKRMVRWHVLPPTCVPNSCIVNIYDEGDCIPPHIDHHDFLRPFCTISFLTQCNILFGSNLKIVGPGEFSGPVSIPLPVGSVLVLKGNGADVAKHCVPAVPAKRISITFRKMDESKIPYGYSPDPELRGVRPLPITPLESQSQQKHIENNGASFHTPVSAPPRVVSKSNNASLFNKEEFPPLGAMNASRQRR